MMEILPCGVAVISTDTHHKKWIQESGKLIHDPWMAEQVCRYLHEESIAIDGGCNIGTLTAAMLQKGALVFAFDPNMEVEECIRVNCKQWEDSLSFCPAGLSDRWGGSGLHRSENAGASFLGPVQGAVFAMETTVDQYKFPHVDLIKLDVEGYEVKALRGARETIERCHPVLILEVNSFALERAGDSDDALFGLLEEMGYRWRILQDNCRRGDPQYDICSEWQPNP